MRDTWLRYEVVDVFTDRAFAGNPLAVVLGADGLPADALQALAREFNLSETAFVLEPDHPDAHYRLRIFTPETELPFAGHPSVGAAEVVLRDGRLQHGRAVQSCGAGLLPLEVQLGSAVLTAGPPHAGGPLDAAPLLAAVGLSADDVDGPAGLAGCGIDFGHLLVRPDAVARAVPDPAALRALPVATGLAVTSWRDGEAHSRVFVPGVGVPEDPATGSAAAGLAVHLAEAGLLTDGTTPYVVRQGAEVGRPSTMRCAVEVQDGRAVQVRVGGDVVPVARGEVRAPQP